VQGGAIAQFEGWAASTELALTDHERAYLEASLEERRRGRFWRPPTTARTSP
jgi:hypothetical protein